MGSFLSFGDQTAAFTLNLCSTTGRFAEMIFTENGAIVTEGGKIKGCCCEEVEATVFKFSDGVTPTELWRYNTLGYSAYTRQIIEDNNGRYAVLSNSSDNGSTHVAWLNSDGTLKFSYTYPKAGCRLEDVYASDPGYFRFRPIIDSDNNLVFLTYVTDDDSVVAKIDYTGETLLWDMSGLPISALWYALMSDVAVDPSGNVYLAMKYRRAGSDKAGIKMQSSDGAVLAELSSHSMLAGLNLAVDATSWWSGFTGDGPFCRYNHSGVLQSAHSPPFYGWTTLIKFDSSGDLVISDCVSNLYKYNTSMVSQWNTSFSHTVTQEIWDTALDSNDDVIVAVKDDGSYDGNLHKVLNSDGSVVWTVSTSDINHRIKSVAVDDDDDVFAVGSTKLYKIDGTDGSLIWSLDFGFNVYRVIIDSSGDILVCTARGIL